MADHPSREVIAARLRRLRVIADRLTTEDFGREGIEPVLQQDPQAHESRCPRYAGVLAESGDSYLIVAETLDALAGQMEELATGDIPYVPVEAIDLDSEGRYKAHRETTVRFLSNDGDAPELNPRKGAEQPTAGSLVLVVITHRHGSDYCLASDEQTARQLIHEWVCEWWSHEAERGTPLGEMPADPEAAIDAYFAVVGEEAETQRISIRSAIDPGESAQ